MSFMPLPTSASTPPSVAALSSSIATLPPSAKPPFPEWFPAWLTDNPYFSAGFGLFGVGFVATLLRGVCHRSSKIAERRLLTTLEIPSKDHAYSWVMQWLVTNCSHARHLGVETTHSRDTSGHIKTAFDFIPSTGRHWMNYKGNYLLVHRQREKMIDLQSGSPWETLTLTTLAWQKHLLGDLLRDARDKAMKKEEGRTIIFHSVGQDWRAFGSPKRIRPFGSVILAEGVAEQIKKDVEDFLMSDRWYFDRGIPYRRGYLLYGPPGCGKTSYVMALAGELKYNICMLNVADPYLTDDRLNYLLALETTLCFIRTIPPRTLILLEDIDGAVTVQEQKSTDNNKNATPSSPPPPSPYQSSANPYGARHNVTFSGLLNALDGVVATEERILFMTTNHLHRLPDSLVRPGRVDLKVFIGWATESHLQRMFLRFFPEEFECASEFARILRSMRISVAELQGFFMFCKKDAEKALQLAQKWANSAAPQQSPIEKKPIIPSPATTTNQQESNAV